MGVWYLDSFLSKNVVDGKYQVDMLKKLDSFSTGERKALTIIIDMRMVTMRAHICKDNQEVLLGGRFQKYTERAHFTFAHLKSLGTKLVFIFEGPKPKDKVESNLGSRNKRYEEGVTILQAIDNGLDISGDLLNFCIVHLPHLYSHLRHIAKEYGEIYMSIQEDWNAEIAQLANERNAWAILSDDTDFLIFEGKWHLWSLKKLNFQHLRTVEYNKEALREAVGLTAVEMPLFASLSGNKFVKYNMVEHFHKKLIKNQYQRKYFNSSHFKALASYIRRSISDPINLSESDKINVMEVFPLGTIRQQAMAALERSLKYYSLINNTPSSGKDDLLTLLAQDSRQFNYIILNNYDYIVIFKYSDLGNTISSSPFELTKPLICRILGILLENRTGEVSRTFYFKMKHDLPFQPVCLAPEYPPYEVPALMDLLIQAVGENVELDNLRWDLLCFIVSSKLNRNILREIPVENLANVLILFYLLERNVITLDEADCILLSCNVPLEIENSLDFKEVYKINGRDARIAFLYINLYDIINHCFDSVGLWKYCALLRFDGLCFHSLRKNWERTGEKFRDLLIDLLGSVRIYSKEFGLL